MGCEQGERHEGNVSVMLVTSLRDTDSESSFCLSLLLGLTAQSRSEELSPNGTLAEVSRESTEKALTQR